jgi:LacI family sucrose operon transcriptional repressor
MHNDADYLKLSEQLPVVLFDRCPNESALPLVMTDSITPTADLISRIAPQHSDEFWFLGGQPRLSPSRPSGRFTQGLAQAGIELRPEWVINGNYHPAPATRCSPPSARVSGGRQRRCSPPPAGCWKGCCAI